jgi:hypothetical protein
MKMARTQLWSWEPTQDSSAILDAYFLLGKWTFYRTCHIWQMRGCINCGREGGKPVIFCNSISNHKRKETTYSENEIPILIIEWKSNRFYSPQRKIYETESTSSRAARPWISWCQNFTKMSHKFSFTQATLKQIVFHSKFIYIYL